MAHTTLLANSAMPEKLPFRVIKNIIMDFLIPFSEWPELQSDFTFDFPEGESVNIKKDSTLLSIAIENNSIEDPTSAIVQYLLVTYEWSKEYLETLLNNVDSNFIQIKILLEKALSNPSNSDEPPAKKICP